MKETAAAPLPMLPDRHPVLGVVDQLPTSLEGSSRGRTRHGDQGGVPVQQFSRQGAKTGGSYSQRMIDAAQNRNGGQALGRFYLYNRIIEKDRYLV